MRSARFLPLPGLTLALLLTAACGGSAPPRSAARARGVVATAHANADAKGAGQAWDGGAAWADLAKLGNYAYRARTVTTGDGKSVTATIEARYHSAKDYELTIQQGTQKPAELILASNGHRYLLHAGQQAPMDLGAGGSNNPFAALFETYQLQATGPWTELFSGSRGTYRGPCSVLGRSGSAFRVGGATPAALGAVTGLSEKVEGTACIDVHTRAPLTAAFSWSVGSGSQALTYSQRFQVTAIGTVPEIPAAPGAKPFPGATGS